MNIVSEKTYGDDVRRRVTVYDNGIRIVSKSFHGESWYEYIIIPRQWMIDRIRLYRRNWRYQYNQIEYSDILGDFYQDYHYGGPGRAFNRRTGIDKRNRRYFVIYNSGGMDI